MVTSGEINGIALNPALHLPVANSRLGYYIAPLPAPIKSWVGADRLLKIPSNSDCKFLHISPNGWGVKYNLILFYFYTLKNDGNHFLFTSMINKVECKDVTPLGLKMERKK